MGRDTANYLDALEFDCSTCINAIDTQSHPNSGKETWLRDLLMNFGVYGQDSPWGYNSVDAACEAMLLYRARRKWVDQRVFPHYSCYKYV